MSAAFTPGPWEVRDGEHRQPWMVDAPHHRFIATMDGPKDGQSEANARLIAAAPELYEALERIVEAHRQGDRHEAIATAAVEGQAALAKARGDQ